MANLHFEALINAPKETIWNTILNDETYRKWTDAFDPGAYFKGEWNIGSKILFLSPHHDRAGESGIVSRVIDMRPYQFIALEHIGLVKDGIEDTTSDSIKKWAPSSETYTFTDREGGTLVAIDMIVSAEHKIIFDDMWPRALPALRELCEKQ